MVELASSIGQCETAQPLSGHLAIPHAVQIALPELNPELHDVFEEARACMVEATRRPGAYGQLRVFVTRPGLPGFDFLRTWGFKLLVLLTLLGRCRQNWRMWAAWQSRPKRIGSNYNA